jgi:hypothetical protein
MPSLGENLIWKVLAQLAAQMPFALTMLDALVAQGARDRQSERVAGVADDHFGRSVQSAEKRLPGGLILMGKGLKTPHPRDRRPLARLAFLAADRGQNMSQRRRAGRF